MFTDFYEAVLNSASTDTKYKRLYNKRASTVQSIGLFVFDHFELN